MWKAIWPGVPEDEVPIGSVTNGVHLRTWISLEMNQLYDRYLGPKWREEHADPKIWQRVESIPREELWRTHERRRLRLVAFARSHLRTQLLHRGAPQSAIDAAGEALDPDALTIASPAASPPTSGPPCCCATSSAWDAFSIIPTAPCRSSSPARPTPATTRASS